MATSASEQTEATAAEIAARCRPLSEEARGRLQEGVSPDAYVLILQEAGLYQDAVAFIAHWLEPRAAVWWGCQCVWKLLRPQPEASVDAALRGIVQWVVAPGEETRRLCERLAEEVGISRPVGALALAAFGSGGSLAPVDLPAVPAPPTLTAASVHAALVVAGTRDPDQYRQFSFLGLDIAHGRNLWD
ncbi:MAG: hypothetical protein AB7K24_16260 [Gemmataceae bacterium]